MLKLVPGRVYANVSAWYIKLNTTKLKFANFNFVVVAL